MRTITEGGLTIVAPDTRVYIKEANILRVRWETDSPLFDNAIMMQIGEDVPKVGGLSSTYVLADNETEIDITQVIAIADAGGVSALSITISNAAGDSVTITFNIAGVARPLYILDSNAHTLANFVRPVPGLNSILIPPSFYYAPLADMNVSFPIAFDAYNLQINNIERIFHNETVTAIGIYELGIIFRYETHVIHESYPKALDCNARYCMLRWRNSVTGLIVCATFEVLTPTYSTSSEVAIMRLDKQYKTLKNELVAFTARIPQLNAYDYSYYCDLINSDIVECTLDGAEWRKVKVTTDSVTIVDGVEVNDLNININYARHEY